jgi:hypothetical protein
VTEREAVEIVIRADREDSLPVTLGRGLGLDREQPVGFRRRRIPDARRVRPPTLSRVLAA